MAKEIPYFKFYVGDWINGDITLESYELQGLFINICAYYWSKDCLVSLEVLKKKFRGMESHIQELLTSKCIKLQGENVNISFLNEQFASKEIQKITNKNNGILGGRPIGSKNRKKTESVKNTKPKGNPNLTNIEESIEDNKKNIEYNKYKDFKFFENGFAETWSSYLAMRVKIKKVATPEAEILALKKVQEYSNGDKSLAIKIVEQSILNSYQGIFPLKDLNANKSSQGEPYKTSLNEKPQPLKQD